MALRMCIHVQRIFNFCFICSLLLLNNNYVYLVSVYFVLYILYMYASFVPINVCPTAIRTRKRDQKWFYVLTVLFSRYAAYYTQHSTPVALCRCYDHFFRNFFFLLCRLLFFVCFASRSIWTQYTGYLCFSKTQLLLFLIFVELKKCLRTQRIRFY